MKANVKKFGDLYRIRLIPETPDEVLDLISEHTSNDHIGIHCGHDGLLIAGEFTIDRQHYDND